MTTDDAVALIADEGGANIGAGLVRLVFLLLVGVATARLAVRTSVARRAPARCGWEVCTAATS